jgi:hypothetical protein
MHYTQPRGQRDVCQCKKAEGMTTKTANTNRLMDAFKDSRYFILLLDEPCYINYANHSAHQLPQIAQQDYLHSS